MLTVAGCMILSIGLASDGEDGLSYMFKNEGVGMFCALLFSCFTPENIRLCMAQCCADYEVAMGERLRLFNVTKSASEIALDESTSGNIYRARAHIGGYTRNVMP